MILPNPGKELYVADFAKIEVAVLWWLANNVPGLVVLKSGKDPYIYQACANTGKLYRDIEAAVNAEERWAMDARQLGKAQVLGAGFRMGWKKFRTTAFDQYRLKLTNKESLKAVKSYRESNAAVPELWDAYEEAIISATENPGVSFEAGKCWFRHARGFLWIRLPSGRKLAYRKPEIHWRTMTFETLEYGDDGKEFIVEWTSQPKKTFAYWGLDKSKKKLALEFTHSGLITENIVQAVARDLMMYGAVRLEKAGYRPILMVHDEILTEKKKGTGSVEEFVKIMCKCPDWADEDLPLDAKGWTGERYRK